MVKFILASAVIFLVMVAWLYVQDLYRRFARNNPELGPFRGEGGCGGSCSCRQGSCPTSGASGRDRVVTVDLPATTELGPKKPRRARR